MDAKILNALKAWGCDTVGALRRMADDEELFEELLTESARQEDVELLERALADQEPKSAFSLAHAAKGVYGNLGVTPLYGPLCRLTDALRGDPDFETAREYLPEILKAKRKLVSLVLDEGGNAEI